MNILAFAATNHKKSMNAQLVHSALGLLEKSHEVTVIDLNDYEMPLYAPHRETENGIPEKAQTFAQQIEAADLIIISFAEYNGSYTPVFKNLLDWASMTKELLWENKKLCLLATSPGRRGAKTVLQQATHYFPFMGANVVGSFSLPSFPKNFKDGAITEPALQAQLGKIMHRLETEPSAVKPSPAVTFIHKMVPVWALIGYALFAFITLNGWLGAPFFAITASNTYWEIAMIAATFTLVIRPLYDFFPQSEVLRALLKWRKGVGLISSGIVVGLWLARNTSWTDLTPLLQYFSTANWTFTLEHVLERMTEITGWTLFLISNKWMVQHGNKLWRQLQKLAYPYAFGAAALLTFVHGKTYGLVCLVIMLVVYQLWFYKRLATPNYNSDSGARKSQAS